MTIQLTWTKRPDGSYEADGYACVPLKAVAAYALYRQKSGVRNPTPLATGSLAHCQRTAERDLDGE